MPGPQLESCGINWIPDATPFKVWWCSPDFVNHWHVKSITGRRLVTPRA